MARIEAPINIETVAINPNGKILPHQEFAESHGLISETPYRSIGELVVDCIKKNDRADIELQKHVNYKRKEPVDLSKNSSTILDLNEQTASMLRQVLGDSSKAWIYDRKIDEKGNLVVEAKTVIPSYCDRIRAVKRPNGGTYYYQAEERDTRDGKKTVWKLRSKSDLEDKIDNNYKTFAKGFNQGVETYLSQLELANRENLPVDGVMLEVHELVKEAGMSEVDAQEVKMYPTLFDISRPGRVVPNSLRIEAYGNRIGFVNYADSNTPGTWSRFVNGQVEASDREGVLEELKKIRRYSEIDKYVG